MHSNRGKLLSIVFSIVFVFVLSLNSFAAGTIDSVTVDGQAGPGEWGKSNEIKLAGEGDIAGVQLASTYVLKDINTSQIGFGFRITETTDFNNVSSVKIVFDDNYTLQIYSNGNKKENINYETKIATYTANTIQYMIETIITYPNLSDSTKILVSIITSDGNESAPYLLNLDNMSASEYKPTTKPQPSEPPTSKEETTDSSTTNGSSTTKKQTTTNGTSTTKGQPEEKDISSTKGQSTTKSSKSSVGSSKKTHISATAKSFRTTSDNAQTVNSDTTGIDDQSVPLKDLANVQETNNVSKSNGKKIAVICVAVGLIVVAAALPVIKNIKDKKDKKDKAEND